MNNYKIEDIMVHPPEESSQKPYMSKSIFHENILFIRMGDRGIEFENRGNPKHDEFGLLMIEGEGTDEDFIQAVHRFFNPVPKVPNPRKLIVEIEVDYDHEIDSLKNKIGNMLDYSNEKYRWLVQKK